MHEPITDALAHGSADDRLVTRRRDLPKAQRASRVDLDDAVGSVASGGLLVAQECEQPGCALGWSGNPVARDREGWPPAYACRRCLIRPTQPEAYRLGGRPGLTVAAGSHGPCEGAGPAETRCHLPAAPLPLTVLAFGLLCYGPVQSQDGVHDGPDDHAEGQERDETTNQVPRGRSPSGRR